MAENKNDFLTKYWHIIAFLIVSATGFTTGYTILSQRVLGTEEKVNFACQQVIAQQNKLIEHSGELKYIKKQLCRIESNNGKTDGKIDKILTIVLNKRR